MSDSSEVFDKKVNTSRLSVWTVTTSVGGERRRESITVGGSRKRKVADGMKVKARGQTGIRSKRGKREDFIKVH